MISLDVSDDLVPSSSRLGAERYLAITAAVNRELPGLPDATVNVVYITDEEIRRLNRLHRAKDAITDVLSFASGMVEQSGTIGDVLISFPQAARQALAAAANGVADVELECADLVIHGILHCLGYDHETAEDAAAMFPLQDTIVAQVL